MNDSKASLVGTWKFIISELRSEDGQVVYPDGMHPHGYLTYTDKGYFSVANMHETRPRHATDDLHLGTDEEKLAAYNTFFCCCGKYDAYEGKVVHHIEVCLFPNWIGIDQERFIKFEGNRLLLSTPPLPIDGKMQTAHLIFERAA